MSNHYIDGSPTHGRTAEQEVNQIRKAIGRIKKHERTTALTSLGKVRNLVESAHGDLCREKAP